MNKEEQGIWVDSEFYFYGKIIDAGGKENAYIQILTDDLGVVKVQTPIVFLEKQTDNILYKTRGIRAVGKQNSITGEIDTSTLSFVDLLKYNPVYDGQYLEALREKAKETWVGKISPNDFLNQIREYNNE